jgi:DNA-binding IclR family transcriptional regulator
MTLSIAKEHRTVSRVTTILERVAAAATGVRLAELAAVLDAPRSSVHGLVKGLVATGYLREEDGAYVLGPAVSALLMAAPPTLDLIARPAMEKLHRQFDETVMLASPIGDSVVYTDAIESTRVIRYSAPLHTRRPLYPTSAGKCILAFAPARTRENYLTTHFPEPDRRELVRRELTEIAVTGIAANRGETEPDDSGIASPILISDQLAAVICISGPTARILDRLDEIAVATRDAAHDITEHLRGTETKFLPAEFRSAVHKRQEDMHATRARPTVG